MTASAAGPPRAVPAGRGRSIASAIRLCGAAVAEPLLAAVFPPRCVCCGEFESFLCDACGDTLRPVGPDRCPRCGHPGIGPTAPGWCPMCVGQERTFTSARSAFFHEGAAKRLVTSFKYDGLRALGRVMAKSAAQEFEDLLASLGPVVVTWVPAHASNTRVRGYNQAEVFARELVRLESDIPVVGLARKTRRTVHQRGLGREGRSRNLKGAFVADASAGWRVSGQEPDPKAVVAKLADRGAGTPPVGAEGVVLVDDVYTTGATVAEVSRALVASLGLPVHVFTFGRTPADPPERAD